MPRFTRLLILAALCALGAAAAPRAAELVMIEEPGCGWCERWNAEIGGIYDRTDEGRRAPLRRVEAHAQDALGLTRRAPFTPTFILMNEGREIGRIEGYPGPDFFWPLLGRLLDRLPARAPAPSQPGAEAPAS
ncbi:hypothetical protein [Oceanicella actignis]|uniref:hypothetical protein n=1 Tax=Oceanicella actignis TaxID=1189325 RepID=UPI00125302B0|nr:hypothetical protein [Oceanicella actignis]TYO91590.1 hypothetical protein LY05_00447 [Oceanicella actignis]